MRTGNSKPQLTLVAAGGTIGLVRDSLTGKNVPGLTGADLLQRTTGADPGTVQVVDCPTGAHPVRYAEMLLDIARTVQQAVDTSDGVVVTHGTDTLEEVAYLIDETVQTTVPIVFTGAMRPSWASGYDGIPNLENALRVAEAASAAYGVLVTLHEEIFEAWSVYKSDTGALDAFTVRRGAACGRLLGNQVVFLWRPLARPRLGHIPVTLPPSVPILMLGVADDGNLFDLLSATNLQGIVVASIAAGTVPPTAYEKLLSVAATGLPIVLCSGATSGRTAEECYYPTAYDALQAAGIVIEDWLSPRKARIRLMLSLGLQQPYVPFGQAFTAERA